MVWPWLSNNLEHLLVIVTKGLIAYGLSRCLSLYLIYHLHSDSGACATLDTTTSRHHVPEDESLKKCRACAILATCTFERRRLEEGTASVRYQRTQRMLPNGRVLSLAKLIEPLIVYAVCKNLEIINRSA